MSVSPVIDPQERLFDTFEHGQHCGQATLALDKDFTSRLNTLFDTGTQDDRIPMSAVPLLLMRAFTTVVVNRPPGNIHVSQICTLTELPRQDAVLEAEVTCVHKETKKDRRILQFNVTLTDSKTSALLMSGVSTIFWAA